MQGIYRHGAMAPRVRIWLARLLRHLARMDTWRTSCSERARQRRILAALSDHGLRDIGLTRAEIAVEVSKPCWRR